MLFLLLLSLLLLVLFIIITIALQQHAESSEEAESAGVGFFGPGQMSMAQREVAKVSRPKFSEGFVGAVRV